MRDGNRIFDTDTHVSTNFVEQLEPYLSPRIRELVPDLDSYKQPVAKGPSGEIYKTPPPYSERYRFAELNDGWGWAAPRFLGEAEPRTQERDFQTPRGSRYPSYGGNVFADVRIKDMDEEGADVHLMVPSIEAKAENPAVQMEFLRAEHRLLNDICLQYPHRLKSMIVTSARTIEDSVKEIHAWGPSQWAVAVQPLMPLDYPLDHPDMDPIFQAAEDEGLTIVHHSFATHYPGYRDCWSNPFIGRSGSHPWAAGRFIASITGSGILDRFPTLRFAILESGFGWLPHWARRLDDQMEYVGYVAENLKYKPSEYLLSGRFFCSTEMHEGADMVRMFTEFMGEDILMLGTDYPHAESYFPKSVDKILGWEKEGVSKTALQKLLWDNPVRCFGEP